ncbi:hypothetical protein [Streptomyces alfalfae]|uniref:hypothetical protein n=1 Tax=Streptomyces alfalfae TaxID=1642299 RepID=UPI001BACA1D6|nr:hypothetical protein [Streptomyces alfalfae]
METWREDARPEHTHDPNEVTVQIDGVGRHLADLVPDPVGGAADGPVFVDATGRRGRRYRRIGMFVGLLCAVYAVAIVATLLSGNSSAPWVPIQAPEDGRPASKVDTPGRPADAPAPSASLATSPSPAATDGVGAAPGPADPKAPGPARGGEGAGTPGTVPGSDPADGGSEPDPGPGSFGGDAPGPDPSGDGGGVADPTDPAEQPPDPPTSAEPGGTAGADGGGEVPVAYTTPDRRQPADQPPPEAAQR